MKFNLIDIDKWDRKEYYHHFINDVVCNYSLTVDLDITAIKRQKLYPAMLWLLTSTVNEIKEFRTALSPDGLGIFENLHPSYTVFNPENKTFSIVWTEFEDNYNLFLQKYQDDKKKYSSSTLLYPKANKPVNTFDVSMLPWTSFTAFHLNVYNGQNHLLPIFTMGKTFTKGHKTMLPLAIQVHHAVCDGYHIGIFLERLQNKINTFFSLQSIKN